MDPLPDINAGPEPAGLTPRPKARRQQGRHRQQQKRHPTRFFCVSVGVMPALLGDRKACSISDSSIVLTLNSMK